MTLRRLEPAALAVAVLVPASAASAATVKGKAGRLSSVPARKSPRARRIVRVSASALNNGTYKAEKMKTTGSARTARLWAP